VTCAVELIGGGFGELSQAVLDLIPNDWSTRRASWRGPECIPGVGTMTNATLVKITRYVSLLGCGMLAGVAATVLVLVLALRRLNGQQYVRVRQAEFAFFTPFIGAVLLPTLVAVAMLVVQARKMHSAMLRPAVMALALLLLALLVSLAVNGPINVEQLSWNMQAPPADWARIRDRWQIAHAVRTLAIVIALGYLSAAVLDRPVQSMPDRCKNADQ
jgi:uncharacterized membrane protein